MPDWDDIYNKRGKIFTVPHPDMERLVNTFKEKKIRRILDLGCGNGRHLLFFAKKGFEVYGFDASPKGIELAHEWLNEEGEDVEIKCHRMENRFPYKDDFFDAIIAIQVIHHNFIGDILKTIKEIERVLRTGGLIFITITHFNERRSIKRDLKEVDRRTFIPQKGHEEGIPHYFFSIEELKDSFNSFEILEIFIDKTDHRAILGVKK